MSTFGRVPVFDEEWGELFMDAMASYVELLERSLEDEGDDAVEVETISGVPFCGCQECWERETWLLAVKLAIEGFEAGKVRLEDAAE
jgi:hypothetical protein